MGYLKILMVAGLSAALLAGCDGMRLQEAKNTTPSGNEFSKALHGEYVKLSQGEWNEGDYGDSDNFANRAIAAAGNSPTEPEPIAARRLPNDKTGELGSARERLMKTMAAGGADKMPAKAANAQAMFDCWMQEQEENFQPKDISACKSGFMNAVADLEAGLKPRPVAAAAPPPPAPVLKKFVVYFPFDDSKLTSQSASVVKQAIDEAKGLGGARIRLVGNTDTVGTKDYNFGLSQRRVESVVDAMKGSGLGSTEMDLVANGQTKLPIPTPDNVKKQENRRVEITIMK